MSSWPPAIPLPPPDSKKGQDHGFKQQPYSGSDNVQGASYPPAQGSSQTGVEYTPLAEDYSIYPDNSPINPEDPNVKGFDFSDKSIRRGFIRKVYLILMVQLALTAGVIALFMFEPTTVKFVKQNTWLLAVALAVLFTSMIVLACCGEVRRKAPANYILLIVFTITEAFLLGIITTHYKIDAVLIAVGITVVLCLGITLFAFQTRYDFTMCGGFLFLALLILIVFALIASIMAATGNSSRLVELIYACLGALLFSLYLVYDTQLMMGGQHKYSVSPEEYIFAALNLYVDIINIFLYILRLVGR